jgi:sarcosine oxidase
MRIAIVGAGIMGLAAAHELAGRGHEVTVLEQFELDHDRGSSHGRSRIVRLAYPEVEWVRMAEQAMTGWRELEAESGQTLLQLNGLVELEPVSAAALDQAGVHWTELDAATAADRFGLRVPAGATPIVQPEAGYVRADRARHAFLACARRRAARLGRDFRLHERLRVESLEEVDGDVVVVTAGAWARPLLAGAGIELPVVPTRETVAYFRLASQRSTPAVVSVVDAGHAFYALPDPLHGLKAGHHRSGPVTNPNEEGAPDERTIRLVSAWAGELFELASAEPVAVETCLYTNTSDERFVLERHGRIVVGSACTGHGFKFAPVVGFRLADLAETA